MTSNPPSLVLFLVGCVLGAVAFMMIVDTLGRKRSILVGGTLFAIGGAIQAAAPTFAALLVGGVFSGLAIGTVSMSPWSYPSTLLKPPPPTFVDPSPPSTNS
ncbi:hypothetical protein HDU76_007003 [Blyttiomyces sp. JEL0837]|nr:hypothetical protein HDU76_007003 [Blyttiomyces sp. JEL0837]